MSSAVKEERRGHSPIELPVPTDKPSPTSPSNREVHTMSATEILPTRPMEVPSKIPPRAPAVWSIESIIMYLKIWPSRPVSSPCRRTSLRSPRPQEAQTIGHTETETREQLTQVPVQSAAMSSAFFSMPCINSGGRLLQGVASESFLLVNEKNGRCVHMLKRTFGLGLDLSLGAVCYARNPLVDLIKVVVIVTTAVLPLWPPFLYMVFSMYRKRNHAA